MRPTLVSNTTIDDKIKIMTFSSSTQHTYFQNSSKYSLPPRRRYTSQIRILFQARYGLEEWKYSQGHPIEEGIAVVQARF